MACFVVPAAEAVITTAAKKVMENREAVSATERIHTEEPAAENGIRFSKKLGWLNRMLWGGCALLAFEHIWHGEVVPFFPFLTAVEQGKTADMLLEMGTTGVLMTVIVTAVWGGMVALTSVLEKRDLLREKERV